MTMAVDELVNKLAKPIMVLRFAKGAMPMKGAGKRAEKAREDIHALVLEYIDENYGWPSKMAMVKRNDT